MKNSSNQSYFKHESIVDTGIVEHRTCDNSRGALTQRPNYKHPVGRESAS
jgi:hypothetical protein